MTNHGMTYADIFEDGVQVLQDNWCAPIVDIVQEYTEKGWSVEWLDNNCALVDMEIDGVQHTVNLEQVS